MEWHYSRTCYNWWIIDSQWNSGYVCLKDGTRDYHLWTKLPLPIISSLCLETFYYLAEDVDCPYTIEGPHLFLTDLFRTPSSAPSSQKTSGKRSVFFWPNAGHAVHRRTPRVDKMVVRAISTSHWTFPVSTVGCVKGMIEPTVAPQEL